MAGGVVINCAGNPAVGISHLPVHEFRLLVEYPNHGMAKQSNKSGEDAVDTLRA